LVKPKKRCGIYILHFEKNEFYVGQAVDCVRRFSQHCKNYQDISYFSFKECKKTELNETEQQIVRFLEQKEFKLRNILLTSIVHGETDLDLLIDESMQGQWNSSINYQNYSGNRIENEKVRSQYRRNFIHFSDTIHYLVIEKILENYIYIGIPFPILTEYSFWCITIPNYGKNNQLIRININKQEVFSCRRFDGFTMLTFHLALKPLITQFGNKMKNLFKDISSLEKLDYTYAPGGQDQIGMSLDANDFDKFIKHDSFSQTSNTNI